MTSHYDTSRNVKLRCDGDHEWGEPYLASSSIDIVLHDGSVCLKIKWCVAKQCTKPFTNDVATVKNTCQRVANVDRDSIVVPVDQFEEVLLE